MPQKLLITNYSIKILKNAENKIIEKDIVNFYNIFNSFKKASKKLRKIKYKII